MELSSQDLEILQFYIDAGVDEFTEASPLNKIKEAKVSLKTTEKISSITEITKSKIQPITPKTGTIEFIKNAEELVENITSIDELKSAIEKLDQHPLKRTASNTVFAEGPANAKIMLIGDTPNTDEDRSGRCFIGESGILLDKMLGAINLNRESNIYLTYMINWCTPGNRTPNEAETSISLPFIKKHIELINPDIIICIGDIATKKLLDTSQSVTRLHGKWHDYTINGSNKTALAIPMFRPEYLMASPSQKAKAWEDLLKIKAKIKELGIE